MQSINPDLEGSANSDVKEFIEKLSVAVKASNLADLQELYELRFKELTETHYTVDQRQRNVNFRSWPPGDSKFIQELRIKEEKIDAKTLTVYKFMACKHAFTDRSVSSATSNRGWTTFLECMAMVRASKGDLTNGLLWDIFDEFIYQLTVAHQRKLMQKSQKSKDNWNVSTAITELKKVVEASGVVKALESKEVQAEKLLANDPKHQTYASGLFAMITLMRIDVLLGDYSGALSTLKPLNIPLNGKNFFAIQADDMDIATPAHISLFYHIGFCYMMLRRYADAAAAFRTCISVSVKSRKFSERLQADAVSLFNVVSVLGGLPGDSLNGRYVDDRMRPQYEDEVRQLSAGDDEKFAEVFQRTCPKFISLTVTGNADGGEVKDVQGNTVGKDAQCRLFMSEVTAHLPIIALRGYFRVYRTISAEKINTLLSSNCHDLDGASALIATKLKSRQLVHDGENADLLSGSYKCCSATDLIIEGDSVQLVNASSEMPIEVKFAKKIEGVFKRIADRKIRQEAKEKLKQELIAQQA